MLSTSTASSDKARVISQPLLRSSPHRLTLRTNFLWTLSGNVVYAASQWGVLGVLAKLGTPQIVGEFALALAITAPIVIGAGLSLRSVQATDVASEYPFGDYLLVRLLTTAVAGAVIVVIVWFSGYGWHTAGIILVVGLAKAFESISDIFYGLLQQYERMDRIALSMMIKGPLSLATLGAAIYLSGDLLLGVCGLAAAWLLLLLVYDARNGASLLKVASRAKHPAVDFRSALARRLQLSWRPRVLVTLTLLALPVGIVMALVSFNTNIPLYFIEHHLGTWDLGIFAAVGYPLAAGTTVVNALGQSAAPTLARYYADSDYRAFSSLIGKLRVPGQIGACVERHIRKQGRPYGVEVVGDPYDTFAPKTVRHPLRPLFRWFFPRRLRRMCSRACAAAYVTRHALQRRYPPAPHAFATHYSSVELPLAAFAKVPRAPTLVDTAKLVFVGTMAQLYKGPDLLLDAIGQCVRYGRKIELVLVGGGQFQGELESRAVALGLGDCAQFRGHLTTPEAVRAELDQAHLFVLPSRQEGLPRAMIEAMARALPCLGSTVGGVPELLPAEDLVPPDDALALANKICEVLADPVRMARMSARNLEKAREYSQAPAQRRQAFYCHVKAQTQAWHEANGPSFTAASAEVSRREC